MEPVYTEIEFEEFEQTPGQFYQALKEVPTAILYRTAVEKRERLAIILLNDRNILDVMQLASANNVEIERQNNVPHGRMMGVVKGEDADFIDGFDTRDNRHWLGPWAGGKSSNA